MKIKCRQVLKELANYMEDDTSPELGVRTERHFQECNGCFATYDGMPKIVRLMGKAGIIELPEGFSVRLYQRTVSNSGARNIQ